MGIFQFILKDKKLKIGIYCGFLFLLVLPKIYRSIDLGISRLKNAVLTITIFRLLIDRMSALLEQISKGLLICKILS